LPIPAIAIVRRSPGYPWRVAPQRCPLPFIRRAKLHVEERWFFLTQGLRFGTLSFIDASGSRIRLNAQRCCGDPEGD